MKKGALGLAKEKVCGQCGRRQEEGKKSLRCSRCMALQGRGLGAARVLLVRGTRVRGLNEPSERESGGGGGITARTGIAYSTSAAALPGGLGGHVAPHARMHARAGARRAWGLVARVALGYMRGALVPAFLFFAGLGQCTIRTSGVQWGLFPPGS